MNDGNSVIIIHNVSCWHFVAAIANACWTSLYYISIYVLLVIDSVIILLKCVFFFFFSSSLKSVIPGTLPTLRSCMHSLFSLSTLSKYSEVICLVSLLLFASLSEALPLLSYHWSTVEGSTIEFLISIMILAYQN